ncbi:acyl carrier protein [Vibrio rotiferianus]|uniref:acyl carrier protein n=1 Tax=Vibrio rotiferianus TaxID=190895 RepID=UPI00406AA052
MNDEKYSDLISKIEEEFDLKIDDLDKKIEDLDLDSLSKVELAFLIEDETGIKIDDELLNNSSTIRALFDEN